MATREYQFITGIETSASPDPATPSADADIVNKGYGDDTYAKLSSWYDKQANNAGIKAIASADRSDGQLVYHYGVDCFYRFNSASSASDDGDLVLQPDAGTGRWIKTTSSSSAGGGDTIVQQLDTSVAGITCGEAIANRDACVLILHNGTGSDVYRVFKSDADFGNKNSFSGFAKSAGAVVANVKTYTISQAFVSGNIVPIVINTRNYSTTYASSSDATLQALATLIATDQDVLSATVTVIVDQTGTDDRVITITSKGGLSLDISGTTVTSGASQPTVTIAQTQAASGDTIDLHQYGPLSGFSGLTAGGLYYLSATAGALTTASESGVYVGQALSSTVLFVNPNKFNFAFQLSNYAFLVEFGGANNGADGANPITGCSHFNFSTWSAGTSLATARCTGANGDTGILGVTHYIDGSTANVGSGNASSLKTLGYNRTSYTTLSDRSTAKVSFAASTLNAKIYCSKGQTTMGTTGSNSLDSFNGSSWTNAITTYGTSNVKVSGFTFADKAFVAPGFSSASTSTVVESYNGSSVTTETAFPAAQADSGGASAMNSFAWVPCYTGTNPSYKYSGTTWSSSYALSTQVFYENTAQNSGPYGGCNPTTGKAYIAGGSNATPTNSTFTYAFNGNTITTDTANGLQSPCGATSGMSN